MYTCMKHLCMYVYTIHAINWSSPGLHKVSLITVPLPDEETDTQEPQGWHLEEAA